MKKEAVIYSDFILLISFSVVAAMVPPIAFILAPDF
jgi:hypothetical protein